MSNLNEARKQINEIDAQIAKLFEERMGFVKDIAKYKSSCGLPVLDETREASILASGSDNIKDPEVRSYYSYFLRNMLDVSKKYQHFLMEGVKVAYSGVEGAFAHIAAEKIFPDAKLINYGGFPAAYNAVVDCECDCAVLPIENSYAGEVGQVTDLMFEGPLFINGVYSLYVTQNLLGVPGAKLKDITTVISHPQALDQCRKYTSSYGMKEISVQNTALAAKEVSEKGDIHTAAIASSKTAELYNLSIIDHDINESHTNTTRFAVFSRAENLLTEVKDSHFILLFTVIDAAGALARALDVIGKYGFNMSVLRSRPMKEPAWQYYFYVEAAGSDKSENGQQMLKEMERFCDKIKVVGRYSVKQSMAIDQWEF